MGSRWRLNEFDGINNRILIAGGAFSGLVDFVCLSICPSGISFLSSLLHACIGAWSNDYLVV